MRLDPSLPVPPSSLPARMGKWSAELNETFVSINARLDGEPVFWFIEGPDYAIVDGYFRPATDRTVMIACRTERRPGGAYAIHHAETFNQAGERDMLIEKHLLKAGPVGSSRSRYIAAESSVLVTRPWLAENERSPGAGYRAASYRGRKYPALDRMLADIPADDRRAHQSFVSEWRRLLR